jgi:hypothetical protein
LTEKSPIELPPCCFSFFHHLHRGAVKQPVRKLTKGNLIKNFPCHHTGVGEKHGEFIYEFPMGAEGNQLKF